MGEGSSPQPASSRWASPSFPAARAPHRGPPYTAGQEGAGDQQQGLALTSFWVSSQDLDCFVIDNNGFILISERPQEVRHSGGPAASTVRESPEAIPAQGQLEEKV